MTSPKSVGRTIGVLFLLQVLLAPPVYTEAGMLRPVIVPGFLENAAASATQIRFAMLLVFVLGAITLAVALVALPVVRRHSERMAMLLIAMSTIGLATQAIESVTVRRMVSMSVMYVRPEAPRALLDTLGALARSSWSSAHFTNLLVGHVTMFVLYVVLFRFALVPRALASVGLAATLLSMTAAVRPLIGFPFAYWMIMPAGIIMLALTLWLIVRGFADRPPTTPHPGGANGPGAAVTASSSVPSPQP